MGFDIEKFRATEFKRRTGTVPVPGLSFFFSDGEKSEFNVHGLTGPEVFSAQNRVNQNAAMEEAQRLLSSSSFKVKAQGILETLGLGDGPVDEKLVRIIAYIEYGNCHDMDQQDVVRLAEYFPVTILDIYTEIQNLTGLGHVSAGESSATGTLDGSEMA